MRVTGRIWSALLASMMATAAEQSPVYSPARPPAIPLAVRSPYTSVWSTTTDGKVLNSLAPRHWTGDPVGWEGIVTVDGISYEYMGVAAGDMSFLSSTFKGAEPQTVSYDSQHSNFTFTAGPVEITASFFSPVTPKDLCRTSVPLSYLSTSVQSTDGEPHSVVFYSDINAAWIDAHWDWEVSWDLFRGAAPANKSRNATETPDDVYSWIYQRRQQTTFGEQKDFPQWGNVSYSSSPMGAANFMFQSGLATSVRLGYVNGSRLTNDIEDAVPNFGDATPVFAFAHDFGSVHNASVRYTVGSIQDPAVKYLYSGGIAQLTPWWRHCYGSLHDMIHFHWDDFETVQGLGRSFETQLRADIDNFYEAAQEPVATNNSAIHPPGQPADGTDQYGQPYDFDPDTAYGYLDPDNSTGIAIPFVSEAESYYAIVALSARQVMGAYAYAEPPAGTETATTYGGGDDEEEGPLVFQKEISSNGNTNTVDVLYPASPFFLYANPGMLRGALAPLVALQEGGFYPPGYCMHDVGAHFPNATGHVEGDDEYMPVEESGNLILLAYAYYKFSADSRWLANRYPLLRRFAVYLVDSALVPASQLSTDDFAGTLTNQTNLALKGIVGLQAMAGIAQVAGETADAAYFSAKAQDYYRRWEEFAIDPSGQHTMLAYQWRSSWGLLYNVYFDKLLNMGLVSAPVYAMQSAWYASVSQAFGVPLDSRHGQTKTDWEIWAAAGASASTRRLLVNAVAYFVNETSIGHPFPDLHQTTGDAAYPDSGIEFRARPVAGAHFALLALHRSGQNAAAVEADTTGSLFVRNASLPLPPPLPPGPPGVAHGKTRVVEKVRR